jgi:CubicO group peptidase (beta-lactamase class C family)
VSDYIPEFGAWRVCPSVKNLFTMTSGLTYFGGDETPAEQEFFREWKADIDRGAPWGTVKFAQKLAALPPAFEPGTRFQYGLSHDVLGAVIEVISGNTLETFCRRELFEPLGMGDSYWCQSVPLDSSGRLAECQPLPGRPVPGHPEIYDPLMFSGGAGLVATARDYGRFLDMLLRPEKAGILTPETAMLLTQPALTPAQRATYNQPGADRCHFGPEYTYSLGMRVLERPDIDPAHGGLHEFGWSGALGTWFFVDPEDGVWFLYLHQHVPAEHARFVPELRRVFYEIIKRVD